jgi:hypothetical protein
MLLFGLNFRAHRADQEVPKNVAEGMQPVLSGMYQTNVQTGTRIHHAHNDDMTPALVNDNAFNYQFEKSDHLAKTLQKVCNLRCHM